MTHDKVDLRIGELLIEAEILTKGELDEAIKTAGSTGLPVGRVLIMAGFLTESEFQAAVQAQSLIRDEIVPLDMAIKALSLVSSESITFEEALNTTGFQRGEDKESNRLGELLLGAAIVPKEQLETAMNTSQATGLPLGRLLVSLGTLSDEVLATALNAQILIRNGRLTREEGIRGLKASFERRKPIESLLAGQGYYRTPHKPSVRIGELLVNAGLINDKALQQGLEIGLLEEKSIGRVLCEAGEITRSQLRAALAVQEMVANETLPAKQAPVALSECCNNGEELESVLAELAIANDDFKTRVRFHEVLRVAGIIQQADIEQCDIDKAAAPSSEDARNSAQKFLDAGKIDERMYRGALRCYFLLATGWLNMQQGIIALNYFHHRQCSFDDVMSELRWTIKTHQISDDEMNGSE
jgi:hypothetical protein